MENHVKNLFLNYAAHLSINCEFINENHTPKSKVNNFKSKIPAPISFKGTTVTVPYKNRFSTFLYKQDYMANCLASLFLVVDKLVKNHAKILLVNGEVNKVQVYLRNSRNHKAGPLAGAAMREERLLRKNLKFRGKPKNIGHNKSGACHDNVPLPSILQGGWINGACSNWSRLRKIAWNSHKLTKLTGTVHRDPSLRAGPTESWFSVP